jgi:hypothetical protein
VLTALGCASYSNSNSSNSRIFVSAEGVGASKGDAIKTALNEAVIKAVGVLSISELQIQNGKIVKDDMVEYSAGFIKDYEVTYQSKNDKGNYVVNINAFVSSSALIDVVGSVKKDAIEISGSKVVQKIHAENRRRSQRIELLGHLSKSYPENAFLVRLGEGVLEMDANNRRRIYIPFELLWTRTYLSALKEHLELVADNKCSQPIPSKGYHGCNGEIIYQSYGFISDLNQRKYDFEDNNYLSKFNNIFNSRINVELFFYDENDNHLFGKCYSIHLGLFEKPLLMTAADTRKGTILRLGKGGGHFPFTVANLNTFNRVNRISAKPVASCSSRSSYGQVIIEEYGRSSSGEQLINVIKNTIFPRQETLGPVIFTR